MPGSQFSAGGSFGAMIGIGTGSTHCEVEMVTVSRGEAEAGLRISV
ncbi:hypothetical protein QE400_000139 [Xanthomonas sacchari]|nr:hypothetical protein [Xanthomonas sacchari]